MQLGDFILFGMFLAPMAAGTFYLLRLCAQPLQAKIEARQRAKRKQ